MVQMEELGEEDLVQLEEVDLVQNVEVVEVEVALFVDLASCYLPDGKEPW